MGNQITGTVPTQILPLDSYFNELQEYSKPHRSESSEIYINRTIVSTKGKMLDSAH